MRKILFALALLTLGPGSLLPAQVAPPAAARTAIRAARLIDGNGGAPVRDAVVLVEGERIVAAGANLAIPAGARSSTSARDRAARPHRLPHARHGAARGLLRRPLPPQPIDVAVDGARLRPADARGGLHHDARRRRRRVRRRRAAQRDRPRRRRRAAHAGRDPRHRRHGRARRPDRLLAVPSSSKAFSGVADGVDEIRKLVRPRTSRTAPT